MVTATATTTTTRPRAPRGPPRSQAVHGLGPQGVLDALMQHGALVREVLREEQHRARPGLTRQPAAPEVESRRAAVLLGDVVQVYLHRDPRGVPRPRVAERPPVVPVEVCLEPLPRGVAQDPQALVQLHERAAAHLSWKVRPEHLEQPPAELRAVDDDPVPVADVGQELLPAPADVDQRGGEPLRVDEGYELGAIALVQHAMHDAREGSRQRTPLLLRHG